MNKCVYCGKKIEEVVYQAKVTSRKFPVCSEACKNNTELYVAMDKKYKVFMYLAIFVAAVCVLLNLLITKGMRLIYAVQLLAGFAFLFFPYPIASFESFYSCPIRTVKLLCRIIGIFFIVFGTVLLVVL